MVRKHFEFTSKSVSEGHPDKVCDRISDEVVDLFFREGARAGIDPYQIRVACETLGDDQSRDHRGRGSRAEAERKDDRRYGSRRDQGYRLRAGRLPLAGRAGRGASARPVRRYRAGRRRRRQQGRRRGRPGHHVRLRLSRDAGIDAGAALLCAQDPARALRRAPLGQGKGAGTRRQEPGDRSLRERQAGRGDPDRRIASAHRGEPQL